MNVMKTVDHHDDCGVILAMEDGRDDRLKTLTRLSASVYAGLSIHTANFAATLD